MLVDFALSIQGRHACQLSQRVELGDFDLEAGGAEELFVGLLQELFRAALADGDGGGFGSDLHAEADEPRGVHGNEADDVAGQAEDLEGWVGDGDAVEVVEEVEECGGGDAVGGEDGGLGSQERAPKCRGIPRSTEWLRKSRWEKDQCDRGLTVGKTKNPPCMQAPISETPR